MARRIARGEIWMHTFPPPGKRRPVLVIARQAAIDVMDTVLVAPISSTIRGLPTEVQLGVQHGLKHPSAALLDLVRPVRQAELHAYVGTASSDDMIQVCRALAIATGCT